MKSDSAIRLTVIDPGYKGRVLAIHRDLSAEAAKSMSEKTGLPYPVALREVYTERIAEKPSRPTDAPMQATEPSRTSSNKVAELIRAEMKKPGVSYAQGMTIIRTECPNLWAAYQAEARG